MYDSQYFLSIYCWWCFFFKWSWSFIFLSTDCVQSHPVWSIFFSVSCNTKRFFKEQHFSSSLAYKSKPGPSRIYRNPDWFQQPFEDCGYLSRSEGNMFQHSKHYLYWNWIFIWFATYVGYNKFFLIEWDGKVWATVFMSVAEHYGSIFWVCISIFLVGLF